VDRRLVDDGLIPARHLVTIRAGERVRDNIHGRLVLSDQEMIKVKGSGGTWACVCFDPQTCGCRIYDHRPSQCIAQKCWAPSELEALAADRRLTRKDLLSNVPGLWHLIDNHESRCDYRRIPSIAETLHHAPGDRSAAEPLVEMVSYDQAIRRVLVESGSAQEDMLDFLLGRPMKHTLDGFGFVVKTTGDRTSITFSHNRHLHFTDGRTGRSNLVPSHPGAAANQRTGPAPGDSEGHQ
jgi:hypothetical protein